MAIVRNNLLGYFFQCLENEIDIKTYLDPTKSYKYIPSTVATSVCFICSVVDFSTQVVCVASVCKVPAAWVDEGKLGVVALL